MNSNDTDEIIAPHKYKCLANIYLAAASCLAAVPLEVVTPRASLHFCVLLKHFLELACKFNDLVSIDIQFRG